MAGVIPPIFASSILMFPATVGSWSDAEWLQANTTPLSNPGDWRYMLVFSGLNIFF